jgi:hypothetical protein
VLLPTHLDGIVNSMQNQNHTTLPPSPTRVHISVGLIEVVSLFARVSSAYLAAVIMAATEVWRKKRRKRCKMKALEKKDKYYIDI